MSKWAGKVAVVTGATSGIGKAIAINLAKNGTKVVGLARRNATSKELGDLRGIFLAKNCDVSNHESVKSAFKWIEDKFGSISILVNSAGIAAKKGIFDSVDDENVDNLFSSVLDTNVKGIIYCSRQGYNLIKKTNDYGMIINISATVGHYLPFCKGLNVYSPSKSTVNVLSEVFRRELIFEENDKIRVSNISPGCVKTDIMMNCGYVTDKKANDELFTTFPNMQPEDIADTIRYVLETPYNVNISELTIKPVGEKF